MKINLFIYSQSDKMRLSNNVKGKVHKIVNFITPKTGILVLERGQFKLMRKQNCQKQQFIFLLVFVKQHPWGLHIHNSLYFCSALKPASHCKCLIIKVTSWKTTRRWWSLNIVHINHTNLCITNSENSDCHAAFNPLLH